MFLQMLCTELQTQNPLDPTDTSQFTSQLTSYSQLEQQMNTNTKLDELLSAIGSQTMSSGVGYLGHSIEASGDTLSVSSSGSVDGSWKYTVGSNAADVTLTVVDSSGKTVWSGSGSTTSGSHEFSWDGTDSSGNAAGSGKYTLKVAATDSSGNSVDTSTAIRGTVTAVDSSNGSTVLELGDTQVDMSNVTRLAA
jgi:flagellar basal-body rod modification protein FlgD